MLDAEGWVVGICSGREYCAFNHDISSLERDHEGVTKLDRAISLQVLQHHQGVQVNWQRLTVTDHIGTGEVRQWTDATNPVEKRSDRITFDKRQPACRGDLVRGGASCKCCIRSYTARHWCLRRGRACDRADDCDGLL